VLLLFNQLIGFVNDSIRSFFFARADCRTNPALCDHLASHIASVKDLRGKRLAINTFGSSADFAIYQLLSRIGLDLNKDVTLLSVAGSPDARFAALIGGSVGDQRRVSGKLLKLRSHGPTWWSQNGFRWERLEQTKKSPPSRNRSSIGSLPERARR
jgi:hypothetical protein